MESSIGIKCPRCGQRLPRESAHNSDGTAVVCPRCGTSVMEATGAAELPLGPQDVDLAKSLPPD